jgi:hypothetical protein
MNTSLVASEVFFLWDELLKKTFDGFHDAVAIIARA